METVKDIFVGTHFRGTEASRFLSLKRELGVRSNSEVCRMAVLNSKIRMEPAAEPSVKSAASTTSANSER
jgi:hypothetical protein